MGTMTEMMPGHHQISVIPLTAEEVEQGLKALKELEQLGKRILARRKGKPLPPSWRIVRQAREELSKRS
jgi:predicted ATP-binding protein involved in virulence